ncbi:hypothetical protein LTR40_007753, partial [Exophiala xenobiotica]
MLSAVSLWHEREIRLSWLRVWSRRSTEMQLDSDIRLVTRGLLGFPKRASELMGTGLAEEVLLRNFDPTGEPGQNARVSGQINTCRGKCDLSRVSSNFGPCIPGGGGLILVLCALGLLVGQLVYNKYAYGISRIPGPTLAAYTNLWRFFVVWGRRPERTHIKLHQRYGPVVRLGPNCVSVSDPAAIKSIYGLASGYVKSDFYLVQQQAVSRDGHLLQGMFNTTDEAYHSKLRRAVNNAFAMSTLVQFEPLVDSTTTEFFKQLTRRYADKPDQICDLGEWLQFYAFDVIGELTFSQRLGFLDRGVDVENIISDLEKALGYFAVVRSIPPIAIYALEVQVVREGPLTLAITSQIGQIPILDKLLLKNPLRMYLSRWGVINATSPVAVFAKSRMASRLHGSEKKSDNAQRRDFLSRFLEASEKDPAFMTPERVLSLTSANVFAGSDTTAITLRAIFYYLLKNPSKLETLQRDIARAEK